MGAGVARLGLVHAALQRQLAAHHRHHGFVAVGADAHLDLVGEIDAVDEFEKAVHEMLARHFTVADNVDAGVFLPFDRQERCVELGLRKLVAGKPPLRPQSVGFGEPRRLRQAAGNGRRKHHARFDFSRANYFGIMSESLWRLPTIEPVVAREQFFSAQRAHDEIADACFQSPSPIDTALAARRVLGKRGAVPARAFVAAQRVGRVVEIAAERNGRAPRHPRSPAPRLARGTAASGGRHPRSA